MSKFKFELNQVVLIDVSLERGIVRARCEYIDGSENNYFVRYLSNDGRAVEHWWSESALKSEV